MFRKVHCDSRKTSVEISKPVFARVWFDETQVMISLLLFFFLRFFLHFLKSFKPNYIDSSMVSKCRDRYKTHTGKVNSSVETRISSSPVSSRVKKVYKTANKAEIEMKVTEEGESSRETMEKVIGKESVETKKTSILSLAEKVNLLDAKERTTEKAKNEGKAARRVIDVEIVERNKERRKEEEVSSFEKGKSRDIEEYIINPQEVTTMISFDKRKEEETVSQVSRESCKEEKSSQGGVEETSKAEMQEASEELCFILESPRFLNGWDENEMEDEEDEECIGASEYYDWVSDISRPRSYWDDLRKQREVEVMNKDSEKDDIRKLIKKYVI